jgi:hypothetical protein
MREFYTNLDLMGFLLMFGAFGGPKSIIRNAQRVNWKALWYPDHSQEACNLLILVAYNAPKK